MLQIEMGMGWTYFDIKMRMGKQDWTMEIEIGMGWAYARNEIGDVKAVLH